ncbi:DNA-binding NarL/FixJ family response regulator [Streptacidiphilus sp. MAP12-16]|uniref:LuxR C-terminal-related transcriptional regulator n=1 Tax=Streptacidiphilus sp. MAP12-16 TaxID=3156300 RepID=UPI003517EC92
MPGTIRILVVDRRRTVAEVLARGLQQSGMASSAVASLAEARRLVAAGQGHAVVTDIGLLAAESYPPTGLPWVRELGVPVIVLSEGSRTDDLAGVAVRAGVRGWVPKNSSLQHLLTVIGGVLRDETWIPPPLLTRVLAELMTMREDQEQGSELLATLTTREREVLGLLCAGLSRPEIGRRLFLSTNTVRTHVQNLMIKLDVHSSVAAVALANRVGLPSALQDQEAEGMDTREA